MTDAVFDTTVLVSAFFTRHHAGGVSNELLRFARQGTVNLHLSPDIIREVLETLTRNPKAQASYHYSPQDAEKFCADLLDFAHLIPNPPPITGAVPRDPDDDKIVACAVAARAEYLVSRDRDLLSLGSYGSVTMISPEDFLKKIRTASQ